jgi:Dolichyl-phosphate-mannose-protein mannosyltransferase
MASEQRRFWLWAGGAVLAGVLLRLWFIGHLSRVAGDSLVYGAIAKNLLTHGVYGFTEQGPRPGTIMIRPTLIRLPGYPLFLAACFRLFGMENYRAVLYVQLAADLVTCWLAAALAGRLFGRRALLPVLWMGALCPFMATYVATPLTETLVLTSIALTFYAFFRWQQASAFSSQRPAPYNRWLYVVAAALSWSILLRPDQGLLAAAVVPAMLWAALASPPGHPSGAWTMHAIAPAFVACLCVLIPFVPWTVRNWHTLHVFQPLAPRSASDPGELVYGGFNRWYRTWGIEFASTEEVYWGYDGSRIEIRYIPTRAFAVGCRANSALPRESQTLYAETAALVNLYNQQTAATPAVDAHFDQLARERIRANPICYYVALPVGRVLNMIFRPRTELMPVQDEWWKRPTPTRQTVWIAAYAGLNLAYVLLALAGLRAWHRRGWAGSRELAFAMAASILLRCVLLMTLDNSEERYTLEFFPVLLVWAGGVFASRRHEKTEAS